MSFLSSQLDTSYELVKGVKEELARLRKENAELNVKCNELEE